MIGDQIRQYRILSRLGAGGMGEVFLAEDDRLGRRVALKFLSADLSKDEQALERFRNEARMSAGLSHPNIASIHGFEEIDDRWFHVHEYVEGETLEQIIRRGPMAFDDVRATAIDLARGLAHAHSRGVIHRDLKPANVILTPEGNAKILDFGLARRTGGSGPTLPGIAMGTVAYMSPEQIRGEAVDHRCDLWALGAVVQEALTGQPPFNAPEIPAQLNRILNEEPTPVSELRADTPDDLRRLITGCLRKDRGERFATAEEVLAVLGQSVDLRRTMAVDTAPRNGARWPWIGLALAAAVALVAVVVVGLGVFDGEETPPEPEPVMQAVTVEDEFGEKVTQEVATSGYRERVVLFFADAVDAPGDQQWLARGLPELVSTDLMQDPFVVAQTPFQFHELMRREGRPDGTGLSRALQRKIAREQMATAFVTSTISVTEDGTIVIDQVLHETESGRELARETLRSRDLFELADLASVALREDLNLPEVLATERADLPVSELSTESRPAWRHYIEGASSLAVDNDYEAADRSMRAAVEADSTFALAWITRFLVTSYTQDTASMVESANRAMEYLYRLPQKMQFAIKANYYINIEQDPDKALAVTRMWSQLHPEDEDAFRQLAAFHMLRDEQEERVAALEEVLRIDPTDFNTLQEIGTVYRDMGRYDDATRWLERFVGTYPSRASGWIELAQLYVETGDRGLAREKLQRALLLEDRNPQARQLLADIEARDGRLDAARAQLDRALQSAQTPLEREGVLREMANLAERTGRIRRAIELVDQRRAALAEALPEGQVVIRTIVDRELYVLIGEGEEGLARAREDRMALVPLVRNAAGLGLAPLFTALGEADSARVYLEGLREFVTTYKLDVMQPALLTFEAELAALEGDRQAALAHIEEALAGRAPGRRQLLISARLLREAGRLDEADQTVQRALRLDPSSPRVRVEHARLLLARDRPSEARTELEAALAVWSGADEDFTRAATARQLLASLGGGR